jgi:tetraacyldisaccharide 4'-kinase
VVGNVSIGGTGKSPMIDYLLDLLKPYYKIAVLSRGYGRVTKGFLIASENITVDQIGDEAYMNWQKHQDVIFAVCESRVDGIKKMQKLNASIDVILLDDAMQHRALAPSFTIALTSYHNLFLDDFLLPAGNLRDLKSRMKYASIIVVSKCPHDISEVEASKLTTRIQGCVGQDKTVVFSTIAYGDFIDIASGKILAKPDKAILVTGIANPGILYEFLQHNGVEIIEQEYADHHNYKANDIKTLKTNITKLGDGAMIVTTEKDAAKLLKFREELKNVTIAVLPIKTKFLFSGAQLLSQKVFEYIKNERSNNKNPTPESWV